VSGGIDRKNSFLNPFIPLSAQAKERVQLALKQTQMYPLAGTRISELSEGQYQRVRIARALASDPDILVLDEPTTGLDIHRQRELFELLRQLSGLGIASITVSHRLGSVQESASHILFVDKHCQVAVSGPASEIMEHPSYLGHYGASSPAIEAAP